MKKNLVAAFFSILIFFTATPSHAVLKLDITKGNIDPIPVAIPEFNVSSKILSKFGEDIPSVIENNLRNSGLFDPISKAAFIQKNPDINEIPRFGDWRQINSQALVTGSIKEAAGDNLLVSFRLWDVLSERQYAGKSFTTSKKNWRRVSHLISDEIYKRLTGEEGYFDSRIVYVSVSGSRKDPVKRLAVMDQDGANHKYLTNGRNLVLTPRFSPNSQKVIYMSYTGRVPRVYMYNLETGRQEILGDFRGMSFAPRFSEDGKYAAMSVSVQGNTEIYEINLKTRKKRRLTLDAAIDTSPSYSPNGKHIVFNSDRGGSQQLYVMDRDGGNVRRISYGEGRYGTPVWSPRGDLIAFTKMYRGRFHIGVMRTDGSGERLLTESYLDEGPTWSPNGRVIMFSRQVKGNRSRPGTVRLHSIDLTGYNERLITTPNQATDPAWSPQLQ